MEMDAIQDSFERVVNKHIQWCSSSLQLIDKICNEIVIATKSIESIDYSDFVFGHGIVLTDLTNELQELDPLNWLETSHQQLKMYVKEYQKVLEETLFPEIWKAYRNVTYDVYTLNHIIVIHLYREGMFDVVDCLTEEAGEHGINALRLHFEECHHLMKALESRNIEPALQWVDENSGALDSFGSAIKLQLHKMRFVGMVEKGKSEDALQHALANLSPLASSNPNEMERLTGSLLWAGRLRQSPYADLLDSIHLKKLADEVWGVLLDFAGQSFRDHLRIVVTAGVEAMPTLLKLVDLVAADKQDWQSMKVFSFPLPLRDEYRFHSVFICKMCDSEGIEENPPEFLTCGHVLCRGCTLVFSESIKCPYCDEKTLFEHSRQLFF